MSVEGPERFTGGGLRRLARRHLQPNSAVAADVALAALGTTQLNASRWLACRSAGW